MLVGTLRYMSPEQSQGLPAEAPSDIFSLGLVLSEMITGRHPFHAESSIGVLHRIQSGEPAAAGAGAEIDDLILQMLQKDAAARPTASDIAARLASVDTHTRAMAYISRHVRDQPVEQDVSSSSGDSATNWRTSFVGRDAERASLRQHLEQAVAGQGTLILIGGEPGVGKTRLVLETLADARRLGCLTLAGHCYETAGTPPFIAFVELVERMARRMPTSVFRDILGDAAPEIARLVPELRRTFPDIGPPLDLPPEQQRRYLFNGVLDFVERCCRLKPLAVLLDDLHWADEPTLLLLEHLSQRLSQWPVLMLGTYRDVELDATRPFAATLETLTRQRLAHRLAVKRLPHDAVEAMLGALGGVTPPPTLVSAVYEETEGNPFFVEEVFHHLKDEGKLFDSRGRWRANLRLDEIDVPEGVRLVIGRRLKRLHETTQQTLTRAALVGRSFDLKLLEAVTDEREDALLAALEEAEAAHVIRVQSGRAIRWGFAHELIRQTLVSSIALPRRQRLHLQIAEAMERLYASSLAQHAGDLAHHFYQAGAGADSDRAIRYLTMAANTSIDASAFEEALLYLEQATAIAADGDEQRMAELHEKTGTALRSLGRGVEAMKEWNAALAIYERMESAEPAARTCHEIGNQLLWLNRWQESANSCARGLKALGNLETASASRLLALNGVIVGSSSDYAAGQTMLEDAVQIAERLGDRRLLGQVLSRRATLCNQFGEFRQSVDLGRRAADALRHAGDHWELADVLGFLELNRNYVGHLDEGAACDEELRPLAVRLGHHSALACADWASLPRDLMRTGDLETFDAAAQQKLDAWQRAGLPVFFSHLFVGAARFWKGQWRESAESFERAAAVGFYPSWFDIVWGWLFTAKAYATDDDALDLFNAKRSALPQLGKPASSGSCHFPQQAVEALAILGEKRQAHALYPVLLQLLPTRITGLTVGLLTTSAGIAAACGEDWAAAERHFEAALREAHALPYQIAQPEARRWFAWMLAERQAPGDRQRAQTLLGEATEMYRRIGMPKHIEIAERIRERL